MNHFVFRVLCIVLVVVINSEIGASVAYGGDCSSTACTDTTTNECIDDLCACATTHFRNNDDSACETKIGFETSCDNTVTATDQCSVANQECSLESGTTYKCLCTAAYYSAGSACVAKIGFETSCNNTVTATDQCLVANQECSLESGTTYKCLCTAAYYSDGSACVAKKNPDIACTATGQCITNAECDVGGTDKCECNAGYTETPTVSPTTCSGVVKFATLPYMYVVPILVSMMFLLR
ncbi:adhesion G protein-coupled receptor E2-like [Mytilus californianus]|uniref:adhesion G protein-coupled receptor E2-like n=1 Tax=Mytilus californianus TaxID=6549 RepID=UPI00224874E6|nr:adhesion G protein-coupled receptor E2-like [Mytilus californianus]